MAISEKEYGIILQETADKIISDFTAKIDKESDKKTAMAASLRGVAVGFAVLFNQLKEVGIINDPNGDFLKELVSDISEIASNAKNLTTEAAVAQVPDGVPPAESNSGETKTVASGETGKRFLSPSCQRQKMNSRQKGILIAALLVAILMGLVPPWSNIFESSMRRAVKPAGYSIIISPPPFEFANWNSWSQRIDTTRLIIQWFIVMMLAGVGFLLTQNREQDQHPKQDSSRN